MRNKRVVTHIIIGLLAILVVLMAAYIVQSYIHYSIWRTQRNYLKEPNAKIESWMTFQMVERQFGLDKGAIYGTINATSLRLNHHMTIDTFCKQYARNCTEVLDQLNKLRQSQ